MKDQKKKKGEKISEEMAAEWSQVLLTDKDPISCLDNYNWHRYAVHIFVLHKGCLVKLVQKKKLYFFIVSQF